MFGSSKRVRASLHIGTDQNTMVITGVNIDMGIHTALRDQLQIGQCGHQCTRDCGAFTKQYQPVERLQARSKRINIGQMIIEHGDVDPGQPGKTIQPAQGVKPVIKNGKAHQSAPSHISAGTNRSPPASLRAVRTSPADLCRKPLSSDS